MKQRQGRGRQVLCHGPSGVGVGDNLFSGGDVQRPQNIVPIFLEGLGKADIGELVEVLEGEGEDFLGGMILMLRPLELP